MKIIAILPLLHVAAVFKLPRMQLSDDFAPISFEQDGSLTFVHQNM